MTRFALHVLVGVLAGMLAADSSDSVQNSKLRGNTVHGRDLQVTNGDHASLLREEVRLLKQENARLRAELHEGRDGGASASTLRSDDMQGVFANSTSEQIATSTARQLTTLPLRGVCEDVGPSAGLAGLFQCFGHTSWGAIQLLLFANPVTYLEDPTMGWCEPWSNAGDLCRPPSLAALSGTCKGVDSSRYYLPAECDRTCASSLCDSDINCVGYTYDSTTQKYKLKSAITHVQASSSYKCFRKTSIPDKTLHRAPDSASLVCREGREPSVETFPKNPDRVRIICQ
jgi:hypothetical protein